MTNLEKINIIIPALEEYFPNAKCSLEYLKDYELLISVMLSAQTTDKAVNQVTKVLFAKYPDLHSLSNAKEADIEEIIKRIGMYKGKAKNVIGIAKGLIEKYDGVVPNDHDGLMSLPGVGNKTANVTVAELFNEPRLAVDTHVQRVSKMIGLVKNNDDVTTIEKKLVKIIPSEKLIATNHRLIDFGRAICKANHPLCEGCKLSSICDYRNKRSTATK